jgi:hypothetical protein
MRKNMKIAPIFSRSTTFVFLFIITLAFLGGCSSPEAQSPKLRVTNRGPSAVVNLTVLFPEGEVKVGDISIGSTTEYQEVPNGVYGYAAYRYVLDGELILQPVIDWVGEKPLVGDKFTYLIEFSATRPQWERVRLIEVIIDE